jgi:protein-S-isoprenylcysteine O-methyltransferase
MAMVSTIAAYGLLVCFFVLEPRLRRGEEAKSLQRGPFDRGSTLWIGIVFLIGLLTLLLAPLLNAFGIASVDFVLVGWIGIGLMVCGMALRFWASRVLGRYYTRTLRVANEQRVVEKGPYRLLRHPGYSGDLLMWVGAGLASGNWIGLSVIVLVMSGAYIYRIRCEEEMLVARLGAQYQQYRSRTWKLLPFVY